MNLINALQDYENPNSLSSRFRRARARRIVELIETIHARRGACRIADLGGRTQYWRSLFEPGFLAAKGVHVTLVNSEGFADDGDSMFEPVVGDACALPQFADYSFDLAHSNSVVEHVGDWPRMEAFAAEHRRLAPAYYAQTPYFWFPIEPHFSAPFFHWRSEQARAKSLLKRRHGFVDRSADMGEAMRAVQHARLLDKSQFRHLFPDAAYPDEQVAGLTKSLVAIRTQVA